MNNLHRELAPISDAAWAQIEEEASRTLKRYLAARRVVDVEGPQGTALSAVGTGHLSRIEAPAEGILARQRIVNPVVELRVPFELDRQQIDDVERGANDSDWQPVKDAARRIAFAEDRAVFEGYKAGGIEGPRQGTSNPIMTLPTDFRNYPDAISQAPAFGATSAFFSCASSFVSRIRLKNSTVSSKVNKRPSCRYGGLSLMPRNGNVLIGPCLVATRPLCVCVL